jgi:AbiJ N-terminal domain 4
MVRHIIEAPQFHRSPRPEKCRREAYRHLKYTFVASFVEGLYAPIMSSFSRRQGYVRPKEIRFTEELPEHLRIPIYDILTHNLNTTFLLERAEKLFNPYGIGSVPTHTGAVPVAKEEDDADTIAFKRVFLGCEWFQVYDIVEDAFAQLRFYEDELSPPDEEPRTYQLQQDINGYFSHAGIGWRMVDGKIVIRGNEAFEAVVKEGATALEESKRPTAAKHLHEALAALSRRPDANLPGAIYHAMGSLECVARDLSSDPKATLGEILKKNPGLLPKPLDTALSQIWGYASNEARHVQEGRDPRREEAELVVGLASAVTTYLIRKRTA